MPSHSPASSIRFPLVIFPPLFSSSVPATKLHPNPAKGSVGSARELQAPQRGQGQSQGRNGIYVVL